MKKIYYQYVINAYNSETRTNRRWSFSFFAFVLTSLITKSNEVRVTLNAISETEALDKAKLMITRKHYEVSEIGEWIRTNTGEPVQQEEKQLN